ncbi:hypothetical protein [Tenacibaculum amylolyticum]|uniref:hypothetical protein n=1 Tax=Tenacibaculum amylolyticum TaxID=104269 RepID=UPI0038B6B0EB
MRKTILTVLLLGVTSIVNSQDTNVQIGLNAPANGVKIKANWPGANGGWTRGYQIVNQNDSETFISFGSYGSINNGVSSLTYSYIGKAYNNAYMFFKPNGNIGIGTNDPKEKLDVNGSIIIKEGSNLSWGGKYGAGIPTIASNNTSGIFFYPNGSTLGATMNIHKSGNVGIGKSGPSEKLEVVGNVKASSFIVNSGLFSSDLNSNMLSFSRDGVSYINNRNSNGSIAIRTGGTANVDLLVDAKGDVGIGTTNLSSKLTVKGDIAVGNGSNYKDIILKTGNNISGYNGVFEITPKTKPGSGTAQQVTYFKNAEHPTGKTIHNVLIDGRVGIGTTTPGEKLAVNGTVHAKEVRVDLNGWPDYVFTDEYTLPTLEEVEQHISEKGHLVNIPSAKEVTKNGVQLGEMNKKLLEKIEELTLYTIQQEKEIKNLQKQKGDIQVLKEENRELKERLNKIEELLQKNR